MLATKRVEEYLLSREDTFAVSRTEADSIYGDPSYSLVWHYSPKGQPVQQLGVLVRGDRFMRGSLWFETSYDVAVSPGGSELLDSSAHYLFYYFLDSSSLFIIPLPPFRDWVMSNLDSFPADRVVMKRDVGKHRVSSGRFIPLASVESFPRVARLTI
jgi:hypothetical protein